MITRREEELHEHRMARMRAAEVAAGQRLPLVIGKSRGAPFPFDQPGLITSGAPGARMNEPYRQSVWIQTGIRTKVSEINQAPVKFYEGDQEYTDKDFLAWWTATPFRGPGQAALKVSDVREQSAGWLDLAGERFILLGDDWLVPFPSMRGASLSAPILARPDRMRHVVQGNELIGWEFTDGSRRRWALLPDQVLFKKLWNPYDDFRGLGAVEAILDAAESDYLAGVYVKNLMRNNGDQGVYVIAKTGLPTDDQKAEITRNLRAKREAARRGDFRPVFLTGDIEIEDAKALVPDANLNNTRLLDRHTVYIGLGLPASMADVQASYSIGSDSDRFRLITGTCKGQATLVDEDFGTIATRRTGRVLTAEADWDEHPVMQEVRRSRIAALKELFAMGMSVKAANDYLDMGMKAFPGWERGYLPYSIVPVDEEDNLETPAKDPALGEGGEQLEPEQLALLLRGRRRQRLACRKAASAPPTPHACTCAPVWDLSLLAKNRDPKEIALWSGYMKNRREHIAGFRSRFSRWLIGVRREVLAKIDAAAAVQEKAIVTRSDIANLLFLLADATAAFVDTMGKQQTLALNAAGQEVMLELGKDDPFKFAPEQVKQFLRTRENRMRDVPKSVFARFTRTLEEGADAGESMVQLAARIRAESNAIDKAKSLVVAQTEVAAAFGSGRHGAIKQAGVPRKGWLTSGNANVRPTHEQAGKDYAEGIPVDQPFIVGGTALQHPGDPTGPAEEVINCHCIEIAMAGEASDE